MLGVLGAAAVPASARPPLLSLPIVQASQAAFAAEGRRVVGAAQVPGIMDIWAQAEGVCVGVCVGGLWLRRRKFFKQSVWRSAGPLMWLGGMSSEIAAGTMAFLLL